MNAVVAETVVPVSRRNFVTAHVEWSQRDELFENNHDIAQQLEEHTGKIAFNVSAYAIDSALKPYYGNTPVGVNVFLRFRLKPGQ